ncbi:MAG: tRNA (N6-isopentenyl adenosine(37)-C2)-methylthiotransferase MiaB [Deltaproteobacteria bacterium]|nr:tRNA (N6-isopentenyl adenosine(37)-C2)-methylthiotransferase MiaB [Deltaproteobacteria bacterium]
MSEIAGLHKVTAQGRRRGLFIKTYGCQMNVYDSQKLAHLLEDEYVQVPTAEEADLIIVNTCSVRAKPEQKVYSLLGELRKLKDRNPGLLIGVGGCVAQQEGEKIFKQNSAVDFVFGTHNLSSVPDLIAQRRRGAEPQMALEWRSTWEQLPLGLKLDNSVSAFVSISRGCDKYCTYCIVPFTRGPELSRPASEIENEIKLLLSKGVKEVVLLGQNVNSYGQDFRPASSFEDLLERLSAVEGLKRIRFTSPHPQEMNDRFVDLITTNPKICRHLHMPLQSGSDRILALMNRHYTRESFIQLAAALRERCPDMAITTDIIVGFPGERDFEFEETLDLMDQVSFDAAYSFVYSPRPGTAAARLPEQVDEDLKMSRLRKLQAKQDQITAGRLAAWQGRVVEVLVESGSRGDPNILQGRSLQNIVVNLDREYAGLVPGMLVEVCINGVGKHTLRGELL